MFNSILRKNIIIYTIILFITILAVFVYFKPQFLYNKNGTPRNFGLGKTNSTIIPLWLLVIIIAILSYTTISYCSL